MKKQFQRGFFWGAGGVGGWFVCLVVGFFCLFGWFFSSLLFCMCSMCFRDGQQCAKLFGKIKSKKKLQAAGEDTQFSLHEPPGTLLRIWAWFEIRHKKVV